MARLNQKTKIGLIAFIMLGLRLSFIGNTHAAESAPGQLIVKLKKGKALEDIKEFNAKYQVISTEKVFKDTSSPQDTLRQLKEKLEKLNTEHDKWYWQLDKDSEEYEDYMARIAKEKATLQKQIQAQQELINRLEQRQQRAPEGAATPDLENIYLLKTTEDTNIAQMAKDYQANPDVEYAEPNYIATVQMLVNDPYYSSSNSWAQGYADLWGLKKIQTEQAWDISQGEGVVVAVIDTGIDYNHEDIAANVLKGYDFVNNDDDPMDDHGHGTHVAGTIAAVGNNSKGIIGVAFGAKVLAIKGLNANGTGSEADLAACLKYAADNGASVINNSWGGTGKSQLIQDAVDYAYSKGCVVVAAAGNSNSEVSNFFPANIPKVITVGASDENDQKCYFSNFGSKIDVVAPGGGSPSNPYNILSLLSSDHQSSKSAYIIGPAYLRLAGTSMASPHVSGLAGLILASRPNFSNEDVKQVIRASADDIDIIGFDVNTGGGRINVPKALSIDSVLKAKIANPVNFTDLESQASTIAITGTASGENFRSYELSYASDTDLTNYTPIGSRVFSPVENDTLGIWDTANLAPGIYRLKLTATTNSGYQFQDMLALSKEQFKFRQITTDATQQASPAVSQQRIVWRDERLGSPEIYLYDLAANAERRITAYPSQKERPDISGNIIVWCDYRNDKSNFNSDIYLYDLATDTERRLTTEIQPRYRPAISDNLIVWYGYRNGGVYNSDIYLYDLATDTEQRITNNTAYQGFPDISGNLIVWEDERNGNSDIYLYDITTNSEQQITKDASDQFNPSISGNLIVWEDWRNGNSDIYLYDLATNSEQQITKDSSDQFNPSISGNLIVWEDERNGNSDIYLYDLATETEQRITLNSSRQYSPDISGNRVVWQDFRRGNADIYAFIPLAKGDINQDQAVNILDVQACANHILGLQNWGSSADVNKDGEANALDLQVVANIILNN